MAYLEDAWEMQKSEGKGTTRRFISAEEVEHLLPIFAITAGDRTAPYGINKWFATGLLHYNVLAQELPFARAEQVVFFDARRWYLRGGAMLMCGRGIVALSECEIDWQSHIQTFNVTPADLDAAMADSLPALSGMFHQDTGSSLRREDYPYCRRFAAGIAKAVVERVEQTSQFGAPVEIPVDWWQAITYRRESPPWRPLFHLLCDQAAECEDEHGF